ncbi:2'-5' RNA ligase family protein [Pedobacter fastidiosus]|uniref:2'-5' RNA ligase family protein n=1 Tax=Pedobacter fastidiosus TaxID=2765361 RepID=A0ABR7KTK2_9SPHI|nr:2'-5' RNA ligase family protein [Pedobacter fastidiosus]MBC6111264.1 2'-5' RNA ligase family protein [Pedobacter fastidiosus]
MENLFLVCLVPPLSVVEDIDVIRNEIAAQFNVHESLKRPAHITLYNPVKLSSKEQEEGFFKKLDEAVFAPPFTQVLKNFNSFPPHTIFIDVDHNEGIMNLQAEIKKALKPMALLEKADQPKFNPHLTIAFKDVKPAVYPLIMDKYKERKFQRTFEVNGFSVYKHIDKIWQPFKEYTFKNPQEKPRPLSLFG